MKKMFIIIIVLAIILMGMVIYKNAAVGSQNNVNIQEIEKIENYISKIYMWKEITKEALPSFEDVNNVEELWIWEVVKKNLEEYEITREQMEAKAKEIFGENFNREFPQEGNESFSLQEEKQTYLATETMLDHQEDTFLLNQIEKTKEGYIVEVIEYLGDYAEGNSVIIRNLQEEEIGRVGINDSETKMQEIVKNNVERFDKKKVYLKNEKDRLVVQKVEKG